MPAVEVLRESLAPLQLSRLPRRDRDDGVPHRDPAQEYPETAPQGPSLATITELYGEDLVKDVMDNAYLVWCTDGSVRAVGPGGQKARYE